MEWTVLSPAYPLELSVGLGGSPLLRGVGALSGHLWEEDLKQMAWKASRSLERGGDGMMTA